MRWEYRRELMDRMADLLQFGEEGWELVAVVAQPCDMAMFYFKKQKA